MQHSYRTSRILIRAIGAALLGWIVPADADAIFTLAFDGQSLDSPMAVATDGVGNVFVAVQNSDNAYKIAPDGVASVIIDSSGDGAGNTLSEPSAIATDSIGNVYVGGGGTGVDHIGSSNVFRITPGGVITEIIDHTGDGAGNGLTSVSAIAIDSADNLYVAGRSSANVFRITPAGVITEIIDGSGDGTGNELRVPTAIAVDAADNVYVTGWLHDNAFKITPGGTITQIIDASGDGAGNPLSEPSAITTDSAGNAYVAGEDSNNVFKITPGGAITEIIAISGAGGGNALFRPTGLATDVADNVYVSAWSDNLFQITPAGSITELLDETGDGFGNTCQDASAVVAEPAGNVYVACRSSDNVFEIASDLTIRMILRPVLADDMVAATDGSGRIFFSDAYRAFEVLPGSTIAVPLIDATGDGLGHVLNGPTAIATDDGGNLYVAGESSDNVFRITPGGAITEIIDATGDGSGNVLDGPVAVATDASGNVYVTGSQSDNAFRIASGGAVAQIISASGDGAGAVLTGPTAVATDASGNVYVTGSQSDNAFRIASGGTITQIISSIGDGAGNALDQPDAITTDSAGNAYVGGRSSINVFKITPGGAISQVLDPTGDGLGNEALGVAALTTDASDNVYVASGNFARAFRIAPDDVVTEIIDSRIAVQGRPTSYLYFGSDCPLAPSPNGNISSGNRTDIVDLRFETASCDSTPRPLCADSTKALMALKESSAGRERYKLQWKNVPDPPNKGDFGNPVDSDTSVAVCIYDDTSALVAELVVDRAGELCDGAACWRSHSKGYGYKDRATQSDGVGKLGYLINQTGARVSAVAKNNSKKGQLALPTGVAAALAGNLTPTIQLVTSDDECFTATMTHVTKDAGLQYTALKK